MEVLGFPVVQGWGPTVLLTGVCIMLFTGRLVPKAQHDREIKFRDDLLEQSKAEANDWKKIAFGAQRNADGALVAASHITQTENSATRLVETMQEVFTPETGDQT